MAFEYASLPLFYTAGYYRYFKLAGAGQVAFTAASAAMQLKMAKDLDPASNPLKGWLLTSSDDSREKADETSSEEEADEDLAEYYQAPYKICSIELPIKKWVVDFISLAPNYANVLSSTVAAGGAWHGWADHQHSWQQRWCYVPFLGNVIGDVPLPGLLTAGVVLNCGMHILFMKLLDHSNWIYAASYNVDYEVCEAANLLYAARVVHKRSWGGENDVATQEGLTRLALAPYTKLIMLWCKTSLLAMTFQWRDPFNGETISMALAILISWYSFVPLLSTGCRYLVGVRTACEKQRKMIATFYVFSIVLLFVGLAILAVHLAGVGVCRSHDLSILHGCTAGRDLI